jgi:hypothetical protein
MVTLGQDNRGNYTARKRLPADVRDEYGRLYCARPEAKFHAPAGTKPHYARRLFGEWVAETEGRIANIRAQLKGEGVSLTAMQVRALAGEWYDWFLARHSTSDKDWEAIREQVHDAVVGAVGEKKWEQSDPDELWDSDESLE